MTAQSMLTIVAPLAVDSIDRALTLIKAMGNPASRDVADSLDRLDGDFGVHFASLHAIAPTDPKSRLGHLVLEMSADGTTSKAVKFLVDRIGDQLSPIFALSTDKPGADFAKYLENHVLHLGVGWSGRTGLPFSGTPGVSVGKLRKEAVLASRLAAEVEAQGGGVVALERLNRVRAAIRSDAASAWALDVPDLAPPAKALEGIALITSMAFDFAKTFLWPVLLPLAVVAIFGLVDAVVAVSAWASVKHDILAWSWATMRFIGAVFSWLVVVFLAFAIPLGAVALSIYFSLREKERTDTLETAAPDRTVLHQMLAGENHFAQNHMVSITQRKSGLTRRITSRLAFWIIGAMTVRSAKPDHLGEIGTIHFARWVMLPGSHDFVFFSNFGGSWESYLEDFITKAHAGLTAVWSNTVGFPRTSNLFMDGATDGERFKRFARHSMVATPFWYSAYPTLTTDNIRSNTAVRNGLATITTDEEAITWLAQFGSSQRPAAKLESNEIQSLLFGGLGFLPHGEVLLVDLAADQGACADG